MDLEEEFMSAPIDIYNNNQSRINWAHIMTTKGLRHLQMFDNALHEAVKTNFVRIEYVSGKVNLSDILTKENKYKAHYITIRDRLMSNLAIMGKVRHCIQICQKNCNYHVWG